MKKIIVLVLLLAVSAYGADSVWTICAEGCDYTSLKTALDTEETDITDWGDARAVFHITGAVRDSNLFAYVDGWTVDDVNHVFIYASGDGLHPGYYSNTAYSMIRAGSMLFVANDYTVVEGLQFLLNTDGGLGTMITVTGNKVRIRNCVFHKSGTTGDGTTYGIRTDDANDTIYVYNNWINNIRNVGGDALAMFIEAADSSGFVYCNTITDSDYGIYAYANDCVAKNNIINGCTNPVLNVAFGTGTGWNATDSSTLAYSNSSGNDSTDAEFSFTDSGADQFTLTAEFAGTDLSSDPHLAFSTDVLGTTRTATWCRGFHEYDAPSGKTYLPIGTK